MPYMEENPETVYHDGDASGYRRYARAMLRTRIEMWRQTGNPLWITEDQAQEDAFGVLGSLASGLADPGLAEETVDFLEIRAAALNRKQRGKELAELARIAGLLQRSGINVHLTPHTIPHSSRRPKAASKPPNLIALRGFCLDARDTPTHRAFGEFILSRLGDYDETFFTGLDALIFFERELGESDLADGFKDLKGYIRMTMKWADERGVQELRNDLAWGEAAEEVNRLAAGTDDRTAMDQQFATLREIIRLTPSPSRRRVERLSGLTNMLLERYQRSERLDDLDECIRVQQEAVQAAQPESTDQSAMLANLSLLFKTRSERRESGASSGQPTAGPDLDEAIEALRAAVRVTPSDHPEHANRLGALATMLIQRSGQTAGTADLDEAVTLLEDARNTGGADESESGKLSELISRAQALRGQVHPVSHESGREGGAAQPQAPRHDLHDRLERFLNEGDASLLTTPGASDELQASLAGFGGLTTLEPDIQPVIDAINFLRFRLIARLPPDQSIAEMRISQSMAQHLDKLQDAAMPAERAELIRALPEIVRHALVDLRKLWGLA